MDEYDVIVQESVRLWKDQDNPSLDLAITYVEDRLADATGETHGRLLCHLGKLYNRAAKYDKALSHHTDALTYLTTPDYLIEAYVSAMHVCWHLQRVSQGLAFANHASELFPQASEECRSNWLPTWNGNMGRILLKAGDHHGATPHLTEAVAGYRSIGREPEALMMEAGLARCYMASGDLTRADELCKHVEQTTKSETVMFEAQLVHTWLDIKRGRFEHAQRLIDSGHKHIFERLGEEDYRLMAMLQEATAALLNAEGDIAAAEAVHRIAHHIMAIVGMTLDF